MYPVAQAVAKGDGDLSKNFWIALAMAAIPFVVAALVVNLLVPRHGEIRELEVAFYTGLLFLGLIVVVVVLTSMLRFWRRNSDFSGVWSGVLAGIASGLVSGFLSCFALVTGSP